FFSVDMANTNDIVDMVSQYASRTNSFRYNDRLVLSTFGGNGLDWTNGVFEPLRAKGVEVYFVPDFPTEGGSPQNIKAGVDALIAKYGHFIDGLFVFGVGLSRDITNSNAAYLQSCREGGKLFMAGCSPTYWGFAQPTAGRPYFETSGGEGIETQWKWIIENQ